MELRGQIIRQDAAPQRSQELVDHVGDIRSQLDAKLREITNLVQTLDKPTHPSRTSTNSKPKAQPRSVEEREALMEALQQQEGRLPGIPEGKPLRFARQTMNEEEIAALRRSSDVCSDSPDIGPRPVSHLMEDTPIKPGFALADNTDDENHASFEPVISANLEQRRKRKDSSTSHESRRGSGFASLEVIKEPEPDTAPLVKPGKRKFTVCDEEQELREARTVALTPVDVDFKFTRKVFSEKEKPMPAPGPENEPILPTKKDALLTRKPKLAALDTESLSAPPPLTGRRALAPKMSNLDVVNSPKKRTARNPTIDEEKNRIMKTKTPRDRTTVARSRSRGADSDSQSQSQTESAPKTINIELEPETPAAVDIFSAPSTAPSTRPASKDTPPPGDITTENSEAARPSRRARASVSYAEPNLRDKMRRPTKELVDAITKSAKQASTIEPAAQKVKTEPEDEEAWKNKLPPQEKAEVYSTSPLSARAATTGPQDILQRHGRRVSGRELDLTGEISGSTIAIKELMANGKRSKSKTDLDRDIVKKPEHTRKPSVEKDVYDFDDTVELGARPRKTRTIESTTESGETLVIAKTASSSRRRQSALPSSTSSMGEKEKILKREGGIPRSVSTSMGMSKSAEGEEKTERLGSRRRSMML